jgi:hypothetical protein
MGSFELFRFSPWALLAALVTYVAAIVLGLLLFFGNSDYWTTNFFYATVISLAVFLHLISDSPWRRRRVVRSLWRMREEAVLLAGSAESSRPLERLISRTEFSDTFQRCIAVKIVGSLAVDPRLTKTAAPAVARQLLSDNPFVRHAAAETLYQLPTLASLLQSRLQVVSEEFSHESSGRIAMRTLERVRAKRS